MQQHIVKRLIFKLNFADRAQAWQLEHEVINIYKQKLEQLLDECFSELAGPDTEYRVDSLELDLGRIAPDKLRNELPLRFAEQLRKNSADNLSRTAEIISEEDRQFALFRHFIDTGKLPWWAGKLDKRSLEQQVENLCFKSPAQLREIIPGLLRDGVKIRRLVNQLSDECLSRIAGLYLPARDVEFIVLQFGDIGALFAELDRQDSTGGIHASRRLEAAGSELREITGPGIHTARRLAALDLNPGQIKLREHYWRHVLFDIAYGPGGRFSSAALLQEILVTLTANNADAYRLLLDGLVTAVSALTGKRHGFSTDLPGLVEKLISAEAPQAESPILPRADKSALAGQADVTGTGKVVPLPLTARHGDKVLQKVMQEAVTSGSKTNEKPVIDTDEDYIHNAGLVITWPYLPRLFLNLGLADENNFIDAEAAERAALLMQYLVDPGTEMPESLLSLNKLLCGLDLHRTLPAELTATDREVSECDALLGALRHHWDVVANMSVGRIRSDFLQRQGILRPCAGNWQLQVESQAHDVLMQRLPWPTGVVKLPWMDYALLVHWG